MRKYGIEHFHLSLIEETDNPEERERFWIEQKRSFKEGYNATLGGDGKPYIDRDLVIATYNQLKSQKEVAQKLGISVDSVHNILIEKNIPINYTFGGKVVNMYDKQGNYIQSFPTINDAARYLMDNEITYNKRLSSVRLGISRACSNEHDRKTAYGFRWEVAGAFDNDRIV